jgi:hypothetical protein
MFTVFIFEMFCLPLGKILFKVLEFVSYIIGIISIFSPYFNRLSPLSKHFSLDSSDDDYLKLKHSLDLLSDYKARQPQYLLDLLVNAV